jgi:hypothetical protein
MFRTNDFRCNLKGRVVDAVVWIMLAIVVPGAIYAMGIEAKPDEGLPKSHDAAHCSVCRHYRGLGVSPTMIDDPAMVLVSPGHPQLADNGSPLD